MVYRHITFFYGLPYTDNVWQDNNEHFLIFIHGVANARRNCDLRMETHHFVISTYLNNINNKKQLTAKIAFTLFI